MIVMLVILMVLAVAGYFAYNYFFVTGNCNTDNSHWNFTENPNEYGLPLGKDKTGQPHTSQVYYICDSNQYKIPTTDLPTHDRPDKLGYTCALWNDPLYENEVYRKTAAQNKSPDFVISGPKFYKLHSPNKDFYAQINTVGELCVFSKDGVIFKKIGNSATDTDVRKNLCIQGDGNLVIYRSPNPGRKNWDHWSSKSGSGSDAPAAGELLVLYMQDNGVLALYNLGNKIPSKTLCYEYKVSYFSKYPKLLWSTAS